MSENIKNIRDVQHEKLAELAKKNPELFKRHVTVENNEYLGEYGIFIQDKDSFPEGLVKFAPEEFIVEEITKEGKVLSAGYKVANIPEGEGNTLYATLVKSGMSTLDAVHEIANQIGVPIEKIGYAGIKDKDAITAQAISMPITKTIPSSPFFFLKDLRIGKGSVQKGDLKGNRFSIFVRTPERTPEGNIHIEEHVQHIKNYGYYNFYYLQRFGAPRFINFMTAHRILSGEYKEAIKFFITHKSPTELLFIQNIRASVEKDFPNWEKIYDKLSEFPVIFALELKIVSWLVEHTNDYTGALKTISDQVQMWTWGFASLLFNEKLSSYTRLGKNPPRELPLVFSNDQRDIEVYKPFLESLGVFPLPVQNLRPFPNIRLAQRNVTTVERVHMGEIQLRNNGVMLAFDLGSGEYATTLLSHIFNLTAGALPEWILPNTETELVRDDLSQTTEYFKPVMKNQQERHLD